MSLHRGYRFVAAAVALTAAIAIALACSADAQTSRGASSTGRYEPGASSSPPPLNAPLNTARPVPNPAQPTQPRSYQRDYPRESTPLNPPSYRKHDLPGEWRD